MIEDSEFGEIYLIENVRAKRIIARAKSGSIHLTHPKSISRKELEQAVNKMRADLRVLIARAPKSFILSPNEDLETISFTVEIRESSLAKIYYQWEEASLKISCPQSTCYSDEAVQNRLKLIVEFYLRKEAKRLLLVKLEEISGKYSFKYSQLKINKSRTRWGSCSSKGNINLSYFCMFLPEYLLDFVIKHELCHTIEMNHGDNFWKLLDKITDNKAKCLTAKLREIQINW